MDVGIVWRSDVLYTLIEEFKMRQFYFLDKAKAIYFKEKLENVGYENVILRFSITKNKWVVIQ